MSRNWIPLPLVQARAHPLYGRGGWLAVFAIAVVSCLIASGAFWTILLTAEIPADPIIRFLRTYTAATAFAGIVILALFIAGSRSFRAIASILIIAPWPILVAVYQAELPQNFILGGSVAWLVAAAVWVTYLQRSKRVRVTFENRVVDQPSSRRAEPESGSMRLRAAPTLSNPADEVAHDIGAIHPPAADTGAPGPEPSEECWAQALAEYESERRKPGLWARAYAEAQGNEAVAKAHYLKHRAGQLYAEDQEKARDEQTRRQAAREAAASARRYEESLTEHQRKIKRAIEQAESDGDGSLNAVINLIRLLGGAVERKSSFLSSGWSVELAGYRNRFSSDDEFRNWAVTAVLPRARLLLPPKGLHGADG